MKNSVIAILLTVITLLSFSTIVAFARLASFPRRRFSLIPEAPEIPVLGENRIKNPENGEMDIPPAESISFIQIASENQISLPKAVQNQGNHPNDAIKILVVNNDSGGQQLIEDCFNSQNWHTLMARDGDEALRIWKEENVGLILLEFMLPKLSGYEVCKQIREFHSRDELPIIFLIEKEIPSHLALGMACGGNDYISKPFTGHELIARVNVHLRLRTLTLQKMKETFTKTEMELLLLASRFPRRELLEQFNQQRKYPIVEKTLEGHISNILKKLNAEGESIENAAKLAKKKQIIP